MPGMQFNSSSFKICQRASQSVEARIDPVSDVLLTSTRFLDTSKFSHTSPSRDLYQGEVSQLC